MKVTLETTFMKKIRLMNSPRAGFEKELQLQPNQICTREHGVSSTDTAYIRVIIRSFCPFYKKAKLIWNTCRIYTFTHSNIIGGI